MANWCSNWVIFQGDENALGNIRELFSGMKAKEESTGHGQLPEFTDTDGGYFFNIYFEEDELCVYQYETKWAPNTEALVSIAKHYGAAFTQDYEESGCLVFGKAKFEDGLLEDICLDNDDFDAYVYDDEQDAYYFEGETYESNLEILETLLERKARINDIEVQADESL
ncbi:hypothetical protein HYN59_14625 [Flavobacterium album]|uniref:YubB ferredoxin-like domain-containing protein n=1 Tax=Flavobacterium album TaxID=2175091 RepID=A0A2S1R0W2_9FLAO|nr:hypothetical protein [Flavobacterium album]AWH86267.1 hypothetical protein HYN59_14625 [Flavobacterium album]